MNTYMVPIVDEESKFPYIKEMPATGLSDVEDRIMDYVYDTWEIDEQLSGNYQAFKDQLAHLYGIYIGEIKELDY